MVTREIPLADKGKAADSIWEVSQCFSCLCTLWLRLVETSIYPSFTCLCAGVLPSLLHAGMPGFGSTLPDVNATVSLKGTNLCTRHFPVKSTRNPDLTRGGYTLSDDSAFITGIRHDTSTSTVQGFWTPPI